MLQDSDGDGYHSKYEIIFDPDVSSGKADVYFKFYLRPEGGNWLLVHTSGDFELDGNSSDDAIKFTHNLNAIDFTYPTQRYESYIELYESSSNSVKAGLGANDDSDLDNLPLEDFANDQTFSLYSAAIDLTSDLDGDGFYSSFEVTFDADVSHGEAEIYAKLFLRLGSGEWTEIYKFPSIVIEGNATSDRATGGFNVKNLSSNYYDFKITIYRVDETTALASLGPDEEPSFNDQALEGQENDVVQTFNITNTATILSRDSDLDGYHSLLGISFTPTVSNGTADVLVEYFARSLGGQWDNFYSSDPFTIDGSSSTNLQSVSFEFLDWRTEIYDFKIELYRDGQSTVLSTVDYASESSLSNLPLEGVDRDIAQTFSISAAVVSLNQDNDGDGYHSKFRLTFDANVSSGQARVWAKLFARSQNGQWVEQGSFADFDIDGSSSTDAQSKIYNITSGRGVLDLRIVLYLAGSDTQIAELGPEDTDELNDVPLESEEEDNEASQTPEIRISPQTLNFAAPLSRQVQLPFKPLSRTIRFNRGHIEPYTQMKSLTTQQPKALLGKHVLMQFQAPLNPTIRQQLRKNGINVLQYVPDNTYWVYVDSDAKDLPMKDIYWAASIPPKYKIEKSLEDRLIPTTQKFAQNKVGIIVRFFKDTSHQQARNLLENLSTASIEYWQTEHVAYVVMPYDGIVNLASIDSVEWIEAAPNAIETNNLVAAQRIEVDQLKVAPLRLDGAGMTVGVWDGGEVFIHGDFGNRVIIRDQGDVSSHATHVAGTIGGSGQNLDTAAGMAEGINILSYDYHDNVVGEMGDALTDDMLISNHSYGIRTGWFCERSENGTCVEWDEVNTGQRNFGRYRDSTRSWDEFVADNGHIIFKAAGNDRIDGPGCPNNIECDGENGYDTISQNGVAKNIITIGATTDSDAMTGFSSWGPTNDGRIKPDLVANGARLLSTWPDGEDCTNGHEVTTDGHEYCSISGTSMASPAATGAGVLLAQHFDRTFNRFPRPAELKALMIHGATDLGRDGPDYSFGCGLIDAQNSARLISDRAITAGTLVETLDQDTLTVTVTGIQTELKVTLVWTDPEAAADVESTLVNDLDLLLIGPSGQVLRPWVLDPSDVDADATTGVNSRDNVEQVVVSSNDLVAGQWTIRVTGANIGEGPQ